jgi:hypothetical protein
MMTAHSRNGARKIAAAFALVLSTALAWSAHAFGTGALLDAGLRLSHAMKIAILEGYRVAPALMLGLAIAIGFPMLSILSRVVRTLNRSGDATRRDGPGNDDDFEAELADETATHGGQPFVEIESGARGMRCAILGDMIRIGREDDNDIRIPSGAVHRYHAAIHREDYDDWHITDLSSVEGNGLIVNGRRCCEARLNDGDLIQLGPGRLRFRAGCV